MHSRPDILEEGLIFRLSPPPTWPYLKLMRLDRPIGTWLLLLPCWWALALAPRPEGTALETGIAAALFGLGALIMRGAGCVINDLFDRDIDRRVARTATRPLASGAVSVVQALVFLAALLACGLAVLLSFNLPAITIGALSLALVIPYPLMKRVTWWPQAFLGLTFNWGALVAWAAQTGRIDPPALLLYGAGFFWTLGYDTIYAHQDKQDDEIVGVKSTARLLGAGSRYFVAGFYAVTLMLLAAALTSAGKPMLAWWLLAVPGVLLARQVVRWDMNDPEDCLRQFKANRDAGLAAAAALLVAGWL